MLCILALAGCSIGQTVGQRYLGAEQALRAIEAPLPVSQKPPDPAALFRNASKAYGRRAPSLSVPESARQWLALADRAKPSNAIWALEENGAEGSEFKTVMENLPAPEVWPEIERLLRKRGRSPILALFETLRGERTEAAANLVDLKPLSPEQKGLVARANLSLALVGEDKPRIEAAYRGLAVALSGKTQPIGGDRSIALPDLTVMLGTDRARTLLTALFRLFDGEIVVEKSGSFAKLAREVALAEVPKMKHPQWSLALSADGGPLFEALIKRFGDSDRGIQRNPDWANDSYSAAATRYLAYLVANGRTADATAFAKRQDSPYWLGRRLTDDEVALLKDRGKVDEFVRFLETIITKESVDSYLSLCDALDRRDHAEQFVAALPAAIRTTVRDAWERPFDRLMASGKVEEAGELLSGVVRQPHDPHSGSSYPNAACKLADIGHHLHRQDWVDQAITAGKRDYLGNEDGGFPYAWVGLVLENDHRAPEAEAMLADALQKESHTNQSPPGGTDELKQLVRIYANAHRFADVLTLLDSAPNWGRSDVAFIDGEMKGENSVPFIAARALASSGRKKEAMRVLRFVLQSQRDLDPAYALLLDLDPTGAGAILDTMHRSAPMAPRPLMWKAELLRREGRLVEAERLVKEAISLDPQDTQGLSSVTRFQAWSILAGIERAEGKLEEARIHQRKFDNPDKYRTVGDSDYYALEIDGPARRAKALAEDSDDFALRMAVIGDLLTAGKTDEATSMLRELCRRLPSEIGRAGTVDWPCQNREQARACEDALREENALSLLGDLYRTWGEYDKALQTYARAIELDKDDLAAWRGLFWLQNSIDLPRDLAERASLNLVRLEPLNLGWQDLSARDFAALWRMADQSLRGASLVDEPVYILRASAATYTEGGDNNDENVRHQDWPPSAGSVVMRVRAISDLVNLIGTLDRSPKVRR